MLTICSGKKVGEHFLLPPLDQQNFQDEREGERERAYHHPNQERMAPSSVSLSLE